MDNQILLFVLAGGALLLFTLYLIWRSRHPGTSAVDVRGTVIAPVVTSHSESGVLRLAASGAEKEDPTAKDVTAALQALAPGTDNAVILEERSRTGAYIQAIRESDGSYRVEYRDGSDERHYVAAPNVDQATAEALFMHFYRREWEALHRATPWRDITGAL